MNKENKDKEIMLEEEKELIREIERIKKIQKIANLKEELANLKKKDAKKEICKVCETEAEQIFKFHVANYEDKGINPRIISKICRDCKENRTIQANLRCPLTSDGYDGWDINHPRFDCLCPIPLEKPAQ